MIILELDILMFEQTPAKISLEASSLQYPLLSPPEKTNFI